MVYCPHITGAYVRSDSLGGRREEGSPGLRYSYCHSELRDCARVGG